MAQQWPRRNAAGNAYFAGKVYSLLDNPRDENDIADYANEIRTPVLLPTGAQQPFAVVDSDCPAPISFDRKPTAGQPGLIDTRLLISNNGQNGEEVRVKWVKNGVRIKMVPGQIVMGGGAGTTVPPGTTLQIDVHYKNRISWVKKSERKMQLRIDTVDAVGHYKSKHLYLGLFNMKAK